MADPSKTLVPRNSNVDPAATPPPELSLGELSIGRTNEEDNKDSTIKAKAKEISEATIDVKTNDTKVGVDEIASKLEIDAEDKNAEDFVRDEEEPDFDAFEEPGKAKPIDFVPVPLVDLNKTIKSLLPISKTFQELNLKPELVEGLQMMDINTPSMIQQYTLPYLLHTDHPNVIAQSQSGSGKTAAFSINILQKVDVSVNKVQVIVLPPTRELAIQLYGVISAIGRQMTGLKVALLVGQASADRGKPFEPVNIGGRDIQINTDLESHIVVATAGSAHEKIKRGYLKLGHIKVLVLDEADTMVKAQGQGEHCLGIRKFVDRQRTPPQYTLFSATFPEQVLEYAKKYAPNAVTMTLLAAEQVVKTIFQLSLMCENDAEKTDFLCSFYDIMTVASSMVFVKTREEAAAVAAALKLRKHTVTFVTGELTGTERDKALTDFRQGNAKILIATDVLSRGIDVESVSLVINYNVPEVHQPRPARGRTNDPIPDAETYIHRIGRTGRFGRTGVAVTLVTKKTLPILDEIAEELDVTVKALTPGDFDQIETEITKVLNSKEAQAEFRPMGYGAGQ